MPSMTKLIWIFGLLLVVGGLAYHFAALHLFNLFVPKDAESRLVARDVAYDADPRQQLDIYTPTHGHGPWPVVVFVHGGSWQSGDKDGYAFVGRALAAQGFVTMVISYRLHPHNPYPAFVEDTAMALKWVADNAGQFGGDGSKLFAMGHSAGAYNLAMAVLDKAHADTVPPLKGVVTLAGPFDFLPLDSPITIEVFGNLADLPAAQPINHLRADAPPFLILHGRADQTVRIKNAESLQRGFDAAGASAQIRIYEDVTHVGILLALAKPMRSRAPTLADAVMFFKDKLK
jgi:acetyl esterase/lipase